MNFIEPSEMNVFTWLIIGLFSAWGGAVRYILDRQEDNTSMTISGFLGQFAVSGFTGVLGGLFGFESGFSYYFTLLLSGLFGAMGGTVLNFFWRKYFH